MLARYILTPLLGIIIYLFSCNALAKDTASVDASCSALYDHFNSRHAQTMVAKAMISGQLFNEALWAVEDGMFIALQRCPGNGLLFSLMAEVQLALGQAPFAVAYGRRAVELDASVWQTNYALGTALCMAGDCPSGLDYLRQADKLEPTNLRLQLNLCSAYVWAGQHEQAFESCSAIIKTKDKDVLAQAYYLRSQANSALGKQQQATEDLRQANKHGFNKKGDVLQVIDPESVQKYLGD